jgi:putative ABC transport system substrate-binding protein
MKRRAMLAGGLAIAIGQTFPVRAQDRRRRVAFVMNLFEKDPLGQDRKAAFLQGLKELGWIEGPRLRVDFHWIGNDVAKYSQRAREVVAAGPEVIVVGGGSNVVRPLQEATSTIPIVFTSATDPVGGGLVASLARPGGNVTGFSGREFALGGKSLELLKEIAPRLKRVGIFRDPTTTGGVAQFGALQTAAQPLALSVVPLDVRTPAAIEGGLSEFARAPNGGVVVTASSSANVHRKMLINLTNQHRLPSIYIARFFVEDGGLASYGTDLRHNYLRAAGYVDRILKGEKAADLPVQEPTKFEIFINLKTARAIGLKIPQSVLLRADKIID